MNQLSFLLHLTFVSGILGANWNYENQDAWFSVSEACDGSHQSPINIDTNAVTLNESLDIQFIKYDQPLVSFGVVNNGHSVQFNYIGDQGSQPMISGLVLNGDRYSLEQFHFHWGLTRGVGSEHTVNGQSYSVELHLVHYDRLRFSSLGDALGAKTGVAVVGIFFEIVEEDNPNYAEVIEMVNKVRDSNQTANPNNPIILGSLLPEDTSSLYRYAGSLTTPPCTEAVNWILLAKPNTLGTSQQFLSVLNPKTNELIGGNFRNIQNLNGRTVEASFSGSGAKWSINLTLAMSAVLAVTLFNKL